MGAVVALVLIIVVLVVIAILVAIVCVKRNKKRAHILITLSDIQAKSTS